MFVVDKWMTIEKKVVVAVGATKIADGRNIKIVEIQILNLCMLMLFSG